MRVRGFTDGDPSAGVLGLFSGLTTGSLFVGLFGGLDALPFHYPQLCLDIKQWAIELGDPALPRQVGARHHALADARWTREAWAFLAGLDPVAGESCAVGSKNAD